MCVRACVSAHVFIPVCACASMHVCGYLCACVRVVQVCVHACASVCSLRWLGPRWGGGAPAQSFFFMEAPSRGHRKYCAIAVFSAMTLDKEKSPLSYIDTWELPGNT